MVGKSDGIQIRGDSLPGFLQWVPQAPFDWMARHSLDFWYYAGGRVRLDLTNTNTEAHRRLRHKLQEMGGKIDGRPTLLNHMLYFGKNVPVGGTAHQAGTLRFGADPATSVLDVIVRRMNLTIFRSPMRASFPPLVPSIRRSRSLLMRCGSRITSSGGWGRRHPPYFAPRAAKRLRETI
jgi:hypothetical protein